MNLIKSDDLYLIKTKSVISNYGLFLINELYNPIIGNNAACLYFFFANNPNHENTIDELLLRFSLTPKGLDDARGYLEGVGLLSTYYSDEQKKYLFLTYSPKSPKDFFEDVILNGLLIKALGDDRVAKIKEKFKNEILKDGYENITQSFKDVFDDNLDSSYFKYKPNTNDFVIDVKTKDAPVIFDKKEFADLLKKDAFISIEDLSDDETSLVASLSNLYGYNAGIMANIVGNLYDQSKEFGNRVDEKQLKDKCFYMQLFSYRKSDSDTATKGKEISSDKLIAQKINLMETLSPLKYLSLKQNGVSPVKSDANLLVFLSSNLHLKNGVINALIDYVLEKNNNVLSRTLVEKIGASLLREDIKTAYDAFSYLNVNKSSKSSKPVETEGKREEKIVTTKKEQKTDEASLKELDELMNKVFKNGKTDNR